jgi:hypothetical protein
MISPAITAIIIAVLATLAFVGGFAVSDWRSAAEIRGLSSDNAILGAANQRCETDINAVRSGIKTITEAVGKREEAARAAMVNAETQVATHTRAAQATKAAPPVPQDQQCAAIEREQIEYIQKRQTEVSRVLWVELSDEMDDEAVRNLVHTVLASDGVEVVHEMEEDPLESVSDDQCLSLLRPTLQ